MPKAAVNEYSCPAVWKREVRFAWQTLLSAPTSNFQELENFNHSHFRRAISTTTNQ
jgi:hypothetical protein